MSHTYASQLLDCVFSTSRVRASVGVDSPSQIERPSGTKPWLPLPRPKSPQEKAMQKLGSPSLSVQAAGPLK